MWLLITIIGIIVVCRIVVLVLNAQAKKAALQNRSDKKSDDGNEDK